jgi:leader peptidase (prepilin peptidase)/N-methyltransferase
MMIFIIVSTILLADILYAAAIRMCEQTPKFRNSVISVFTGKDIDLSLLLTEAVTVIATLTILQIFDNTINLLGALLFTYCLITLSVVDMKTQIIPDIISKPLIVLGIIFAYFSNMTSWQDSIIGAFVGYWLFWSINTLFRIIRKKEGMGYGDFKLISAILAWLGWKVLMIILIIAPILSIALTVTFFVASRGKLSLNDPFPFGPSLAAAAFISLIYREELLGLIFI